MCLPNTRRSLFTMPRTTLSFDIIQHTLLPFLWPSQILALRLTCSRLSKCLSDDKFLENALEDKPKEDTLSMRYKHKFHHLLPQTIENRFRNFISSWQNRIEKYFQVKVEFIMPEPMFHEMARHSACSLLVTKFHDPSTDEHELRQESSNLRGAGVVYEHSMEQQRFFEEYIRWHTVLHINDEESQKRRLYERPYLVEDVELHAQHLYGDFVEDTESDFTGSRTVHPFMLPVSFKQIDDYGNRNFHFLVHDAHTWVDGQVIRLEKYPVVFADDEDCFFFVDRKGTAFIQSGATDEEDHEIDSVWKFMKHSCWPREPLPVPTLSQDARNQNWHIAKCGNSLQNLIEWKQARTDVESVENIYRLDMHCDHELEPDKRIIVSKRTGEVISNQDGIAEMLEPYKTSHGHYSHEQVAEKWYVLNGCSEDHDLFGFYALGNQFFVYQNVSQDGDESPNSLKRKREEME
mmetsp:Transcript_456/g.1740  ORF Transcript_456/g.1740 Transcript_456/m.1740 type:complete len:462 (+) Transcript_456:1431-2816(+)